MTAHTHAVQSEWACKPTIRGNKAAERCGLFCRGRPTMLLEDLDDSCIIEHAPVQQQHHLACTGLLLLSAVNRGQCNTA